jgi:hypothetical protein
MRWLIFALALLLSGANKKKDDGKIPDSQIMYRIIDYKQSYDTVTKKEHLAIKVTPPLPTAADKSVIVEVYNNMKRNLSFMKFDIFLHNKDGFDLSTEVSADEILRGQSAIRKVVGKPGMVPHIVKVTIENVVALDDKAAYIKPPVIVDLIRTESKPVKKGR